MTGGCAMGDIVGVSDDVPEGYMLLKTITVDY